MMNRKFLQQTFDLALENVARGGGPFAAIIVQNGAFFASGTNQVTRLNDPTAHAEINAIRAACSALGDFNLSGYTIYSSCEPCPMCLSAIYWAHLDAVYYGASHKDAADAGFDDSYIYHELQAKSAHRHLEQHQIAIGNEKTPFDAWKIKEDKLRY